MMRMESILWHFILYVIRKYVYKNRWLIYKLYNSTPSESGIFVELHNTTSVGSSIM